MTIYEDIKNLEYKIEQSRKRIAQANKQYKNALVNLEKQKRAVEKARLDIDRVKIHISNRLTTLQAMRECAARKQASQEQQTQTYCFNVAVNSEPVQLVLERTNANK